MAKFYKCFLLQDTESKMYVRYIDVFAEDSRKIVATTQGIADAMMFDSVFEAEHYLRGKAELIDADIHLSLTIVETYNISKY